MAILTINDVMPEDSVVFKCVAINKVGKAETSCRLNVQGKPMSHKLENWSSHFDLLDVPPEMK